MKDFKKKLGRQLKTSIITSIGLATILTGSDLNPDIQEKIQENSHEAVIESYRKTKPKETSKTEKILLKLPALLRILISVPLWLFSSIVLFILDELLKLLFLPILSFLLTLLLFFLILLLVAVLAIKCLFPERSYKEICNRKLIKDCLIMTLLSGLIDLILTLTLNDSYRILVYTLTGAISLAYILMPYIREFKEKERKPKIISDYIDTEFIEQSINRR